MTHKIENEYLSVEVVDSGAELYSLFNKIREKEYLWQGDNKWWPRRAPVLFPIVGKLNNNSYKVDNEIYSLPQHGFARDKKFLLAAKTGNSLTFLLSSDEESIKKFPFEFELYIHYLLDQSKLTITYEVINKDQKEMPFSIGAHPGFNCPLNEDESFSDYYLEFEKPETLERHLLDEGNFNGKTEALMNNTRILELDESLFQKDAVVFKNMNSESMTLKSKISDYSLKFSFSHFPYFGIWKKPGAPFICLEPWCGIADNKNFSGDLKNKKGINLLKENGTFTRSYTLEI